MDTSNTNNQTPSASQPEGATPPAGTETLPTTPAPGFENAEAAEPYVANEDTGSGRGDRRNRARGVIILILSILVLWLLSDRNSTFFYLSTDDNAFVVRKGWFFPFGSSRYEPDDPAARAAYQPIEVPPEQASFRDRAYRSLSALNDDLATILIEAANRRLYSNEGAVFDKGREYVRRAAMLPGLSAAAEKTVREARGALSYLEAVAAVVGLEERIVLARDKFRAARELGDIRHAEEVERWLDVTENYLHVIREFKPRQGEEAGAIKALNAPAALTVPKKEAEDD